MSSTVMNNSKAFALLQKNLDLLLDLERVESRMVFVNMYPYYYSIQGERVTVDYQFKDWVYVDSIGKRLFRERDGYTQQLHKYCKVHQQSTATGRGSVDLKMKIDLIYCKNGKTSDRFDCSCYCPPPCSWNQLCLV